MLPGGPPWEVDSTGGQEHLFVIVSPTPVPEIAEAVAALPPATGEPRSDGNLALNTRGIGSRRRASAADAARPWRRQATAAPARSPAGGRPLGPRARPEEPLTSAEAPPAWHRIQRHCIRIRPGLRSLRGHRDRVRQE